MTIQQLEEEIADTDTEEESEEVEPVEEEGDWHSVARQELERRNLGDLEEHSEFVDLSLTDNVASSLYGYLVMEPSNGSGYVAKRLSSGKPRYLNSEGNKPEFVFGEESSGVVWVVESVLDAAALYKAGASYVLPVLGTEVSDTTAYKCRGKVALVVFDADAAGFKGTQDALKTLRFFGARAYQASIESIASPGSDVGDVFADRPEDLSAWVHRLEDEYSQGSREYIEKLFLRGEGGQTPIPSGIQGLDAVVGGGLVPSLYVLGGGEGIGKSTILMHMMRSLAEDGHKVTYVTYEMPKPETYARLAAGYSSRGWFELRKRPTSLEKGAYKKLEKLSDNITVMSDLPRNSLHAVAKDTDVLLLDYLQEVPGNSSTEGPRERVEALVSMLDSLAREHEVITLAVSSLSHSNEFRESRNIRYKAPFLFMLRGNSTDKGRMVLSVEKSRVSPPNRKVYLEIDYASQTASGQYNPNLP